MKNIIIKQVYYEPLSLYQKANTKSQRALVGYMVKAGYARDPIYGGAFSLLKRIENCAGIYILDTTEDEQTAMEIIDIAESAMKGLWDAFQFTEKQLTDLKCQFDDLSAKGGRR